MFGSHDTSPSHFSLGAITIFVRPSRSASSQFVQGSDATTAPATCPALIPKPDSRYASAAIASSASSAPSASESSPSRPRASRLGSSSPSVVSGNALSSAARARAREPREPQVRARHDRRLRRDRARAARRDQHDGRRGALRGGARGGGEATRGAVFGARLEDAPRRVAALGDAGAPQEPPGRLEDRGAVVVALVRDRAVAVRNVSFPCEIRRGLGEDERVRHDGDRPRAVARETFFFVVARATTTPPPTTSPRPKPPAIRV